MSIIAAPPAVEAAYDALAPAYDLLTADYGHEQWLAALEKLALAHGLAGSHVLDVACGTGESFMPLLARGYEVTGCDISSRMLDLARRKAPEAALHQADMRCLPNWGEFDLVTCLDDPLNYVLAREELLEVFRGFARNLAPGGLAIWDLNTLAQYRHQFASDRILVDDNTFIGWRRGSGAGAVQSGALVEVAIDVFSRDSEDTWQRSTSLHRQRHWPREEIERLCGRAGLRLLTVRGQHQGGVITDLLEELVHTKAVYVATAERRS